MELRALVDRIAERAKTEHDIAKNSAVVAELLQPELDKFEVRIGPWNTYAVRVAIDHRHSAKKDAAFADDLDAVVAHLRSLLDSPIEKGDEA